MTDKERIKVILADDHAVVRSGIRQFLESTNDIQVLDEAENGEFVKVLIQKHHPDVVVLDIQMPKLSGIDVTRWLRKNDLKIGVLILTAYDEDPYVNAVLQAGANGFVLKTASPEEIIKAVKDVHEGKSVLDPEHEVLSLVAKGYTNKAIGVQLSISDRTVQGHIAHIFTKLQASSRTEAVMRAVSLGWLPGDISKID